jgi:uncharacterized protein (DUF169 family)
MSKTAKHYLKNGKEYTGAVHKMNGQVHTGAKHTAASKVLTHTNPKKMAVKKPKLKKK